MDTLKRIQREAELRRIELALGLVTKADVIAWTDGVIISAEAVPHVILEVSLARNKTDQDMYILLAELAGDTDKEEPHAAAFRHFARSLLDKLDSGTMGYDDAAAGLHRAAYETDLTLPEEVVLQCDWFYDEFECVRRGILSREAMEEELKRFLEIAAKDVEF